jgi:hypothetical protein
LAGTATKAVPGLAALELEELDELDEEELLDDELELLEDPDTPLDPPPPPPPPPQAATDVAPRAASRARQDRRSRSMGLLGGGESDMRSFPVGPGSAKTERDHGMQDHRRTSAS